MKRSSSFLDAGQGSTKHKFNKEKKYATLNKNFTDKEITRYYLIFMKNLASEDFPRIKEYFSHFSEENIGYFFEQKGFSILNQLLSFTKNIKNKLDFIFENIPKTSITRVLQQKNFSLLTNFLNGILSQEKRNINTDETRAFRITQFEFIIHFLGRENFETLFNENKELITAKIKEDFSAAKNEYIPSTSHFKPPEEESVQILEKKPRLY